MNINVGSLSLTAGNSSVKRYSTEQGTLLARGPERQENTPLKGIFGTPRTKLRSTAKQREDNGEKFAARASAVIYRINNY